MHRLHYVRWLALIVAVFSSQCVDDVSGDCRKTLTCVDQLPTLRSDCTWRYPDGSLWESGPRRTPEGRWIWPDGRETKTQNLECPAPDAGAPVDAGLAFGDCPRIACDEGLFCEEETGRCVQCLGDDACVGVSDPNRGALRFCDPRRHECVVCLGDENCETDENCKVDANNAANNRCVDCVKQEAEQCPADQVCNLGSNECTTTCTGPGMCRPPKSICSNTATGIQSGLCVQCLENGDCPAPQQCNTARKECVECVDTCLGGLVCNAANRCVQCVDDTQCGGDTRHCDLASNKCVACLGNAQCTGRDSSKCNAVTHVCEPCTDDTQCEGDAPVCSNGSCVACRNESTCTSPEAPLCDVASGTCVACLNNGNCNQDPTLARCESRRCQFCTSSTQCTGKFGVRNICSMSNGECVQCAGNPDCAADVTRSRCDINTGLCARCQADGDCNSIAGRRACTLGNNARCVECVNATHCVGNPNGLACNSATNTCVQCVADTDCRGAGASRCLNNQCVPCVNDGGGNHCGHVVNGSTALRVCDTSGAAGVCVQCTGAERDACNGNVCNSLTKICSPFAPGDASLCEDCVSDAHCGTNLRCMQERFNNSPIAATFACFPVDQSGACPLTPFAGLQSLPTIDGVTEQVCMLRRTTCAGFNQANNQPCTVNGNCGDPNFDDGRCDTGAGVCSIPCTSGSDCQSGDNNSCLGGACLL